MLRVSGHFGDEDVELVLAKTAKAALAVALEMQARGRERITIERRATGARLTVELFALRHGLRSWKAGPVQGR